MRMRIWSTNLTTTITKFDVFSKELEGTISQKTKALADQILEDSNTIPPMVPVDTGNLQETGRVEKAGRGWAVEYGDMTVNGVYVDYAAQVHDDLRPRKYKREGSGPKFVETHYLRRTDTAAEDYEETLQLLAERIFK